MHRTSVYRWLLKHTCRANPSAHATGSSAVVCPLVLGQVSKVWLAQGQPWLANIYWAPSNVTLGVEHWLLEGQCSFTAKPCKPSPVALHVDWKSWDSSWSHCLHRWHLEKRCCYHCQQFGTASGGERQPGDWKPGPQCPPKQLEMQISHTVITHKFQLLFQPHKPPVMKLKGIYFLINVTVISRKFRCLELVLHNRR
jgi:hypothetical protein